MYERRQPRPSGPNWIGVSFLLFAVLIAVVVIAMLVIGVAGPPGAAPSDRPSPSVEPSVEPSPSPSEGPAAPPSDGSAAPSPSIGVSPLPSPAPSEPSSSEPATGVESCSGSDDNREFFASAAESLGFDVYCAALPEGWRLLTGSRSGGGAGQLVVEYRGPDGATFSLREGDACAGADECPPAGPSLGTVAFGDRSGDLRQMADGFAIIIEETASRVYIADFVGVDEETARSIGAGLVKVE